MAPEPSDLLWQEPLWAVGLSAFTNTIWPATSRQLRRPASVTADVLDRVEPPYIRDRSVDLLRELDLHGPRPRPLSRQFWTDQASERTRGVAGVGAAARYLMSALTHDLHVCRSEDVIDGDRIDMIRDHGLRLEGDRSQ